MIGASKEYDLAMIGRGIFYLKVIWMGSGRVRKATAFIKNLPFLIVWRNIQMATMVLQNIIEKLCVMPLSCHNFRVRASRARE